MRYITALLFLLASGVASASVVTLEWDAPTEREDGTPLTVSELGAYILGCAKDGGDYIDVLSIPPDQTETETSRFQLFADTGFGEYTCALAAVDSDGLRSDWSNTVMIDWQQMPPAAPSLRVVIR